MSSSAAAPSFSGEELPPVTVPPVRKAGAFAARSARVTRALIPSSWLTGPREVVTGAVSASNRPASRAAVAS